MGIIIRKEWVSINWEIVNLLISYWWRKIRKRRKNLFNLVLSNFRKKLNLILILLINIKTRGRSIFFLNHWWGIVWRKIGSKGRKLRVKWIETDSKGKGFKVNFRKIFSRGRKQKVMCRNSDLKGRRSKMMLNEKRFVCIFSKWKKIRSGQVEWHSNK